MCLFVTNSQGFIFGYHSTTQTLIFIRALFCMTFQQLYTAQVHNFKCKEPPATSFGW